MCVPLIAGACDSLTQRVHAESRDRGHAVAVEVTPDGHDVVRAVDRHAPDLIVAPVLKTVVPREVWASRTRPILHPGPVGDRDPSSLDRAIHEDAGEWGVTLLQAEEETDAGPVWATAAFPVPRGSLPRRAGGATARRLTEEALPVGAGRARDIGLAGLVVECAPADFAAEVTRPGSPGAQARLAAKKAECARREAVTPPAAVREREFARMRRISLDPGAPHHAPRRAFLRKERAS
ncbi:hypothetical protein GCM10019016_135350 [Streptomyces prasinosporus]|uniref:Hydrogenase maturation protein n=1 Tax=Streptomyces prasinosporus TaxID=68256 RepID=A0ABP6UHQ6_9ACTN